MPHSESGVSITRISPYLSWRPAVAPKTPPFLPMSSPRQTTESSRSIATWSASFSAWIIVISGIASPSRSGGPSQGELPAGVLDRARPLDLVEDGRLLLGEVRGERGVDVGEERLDRRGRRLLGRLDGLADLLLDRLDDLLLPGLRPEAAGL